MINAQILEQLDLDLFYLDLFVVLRCVQQPGSYCDGSLQVEETTRHRQVTTNFPT